MKYKTVFILKIIEIECFQNIKSFYDSKDSYYIITSEEIKYYTNESFINIETFLNDHKIIFENEAEIVSYGKFKDSPNVADLIIVKNR